MSSAAAADNSVFEGSSVISGYTTGYTSLAPGVERYDIEDVDAADVQGLDLDGLGFLPTPPAPTTDTTRIQPPQSSASKKFAWEDERELLTRAAERELLAAVGDGAGDDASECYASSQSSVGTAGSTAASTAPVSVALTGFNALLSIDEQNVMSTAFEAGELGINLDALDDGGGLEASASMRSGSSIAGSDLSRQAAAESALDAYMQRQPPELRSGSSIADSDLSRQTAVTAPESGLNTFMQRQPPENLEASQFSRAAEAALDTFVDRLPASSQVSGSRMSQIESEAQSMSAWSGLEGSGPPINQTSVEIGAAETGMNLDALASTRQPEPTSSTALLDDRTPAPRAPASQEVPTVAAPQESSPSARDLIARFNQEQ
jgi:hypothetical protein